MASNVAKWTSAGTDAMHIGYRGGTGYIAGFGNLTASSTGQLSEMRRLLAAQAFPLSVLEPNVVAVKGDDGLVDAFQFGSDAVNKGTLELGVWDQDVQAALEGVSKFAQGAITWSGAGSGIANPGTFMVAITRQAHSFDSGSLGQGGFKTDLWLNIRAKYMGGDPGQAQQKEGKARYQVISTESTVSPYNVTAGTIATQYGVRSRAWLEVFTDNRLAFGCFVGDGVIVTPPALQYTPISAAKVYAYNTTNGTALTVSSVNTSAKTFTLSAAPASGTIVYFAYETASFT